MLDKAALWVYLGAFGLLVAAGFGFPIPEELPIVAAGAAVGHASEDPSRYDFVPEVTAALDASPSVPFPASLSWHGMFRASQVKAPSPSGPGVRLRWYIMLPVLILGVVVSDGLLYGMGRFWGRRLLELRGIKRLVPPQKRQRIEENFDKYGVLVLLFARFLPTIRAPIFITAGIMRVPFKRFVMADGLYAIPGVSLLFFLAYWLGDSFRDLIIAAEKRVGATTKPILILAGLAAVTAYLIYHFLRHPVATGDPREELPVIGGQFASKMASSAGQSPRLKEGELACPDGATAGNSERKPSPQERSPTPHSSETKDS